MSAKDKVLDILRTATPSSPQHQKLIKDVTELIDTVHQEAYNAGHDEGYDEGYEWGRREGLEEGEKKGYDKGYTEGTEDAGERIREKGFGLDWSERERISRIARGIY